VVVPPPPGFAAPPVVEQRAPPSPPPPPDPRRDPFAVAAPAAGAFLPAPVAEPTYVVVEAGAPSDELGRRRYARYAKWAGLILVPLVLGYLVGGIGAGRKAYNRTIADAATIKADVEGLGKTLERVVDVLRQSATRAKGAADFKLIDDLAALKLQPPDAQRTLFHTNYYYLEDLVINRLFGYYNETIELYRLVNRHVERTTRERSAIESFMTSEARMAGEAGRTNYGVVFSTEGALPVANLVEVGQRVCKGGGSDCRTAADLIGFEVRSDTGGTWVPRKLKGQDAERLVPLQPTPFMRTAMSGRPELLSMRDYERRLRDIRFLCEVLQRTQKELLADLKRAAERDRLVTLF
jgi:hypothetical protein